VQRGGLRLRDQGLRAAPSLNYQQDTPPFSLHFNDSDGDDSVDQGPTGGHDWDGRASSAHEQAAGPLLSPAEMANPTPQAVVQRLRASPRSAAFRAAFGPHALDDEAQAWKGLLWALEVYQQSPADFYPYTSKYDAFLRHQAKLSPAEQRGLALFNDANKGNCSQCHPSAIKRGAFPQFTDRGYAALGLPRHRGLKANADPAFFDLGLCGPLRQDLAAQPELCGQFKVPSLRNVALRQSLFHNGVFHRLEDAIRFYVQRDLSPQRYYGRGPRFNDLPAPHRGNVSTEPPFKPTAQGRPRLNEAEIRDVAAFLRTLTDGYWP
jgi:cytochrome c peroxidase